MDSVNPARVYPLEEQEYIEFKSELRALAESALSRGGFCAGNIVGSVLVSIDDGCGAIELVRDMAAFLKESGIFSFNGRKDVIDFKVDPMLNRTISEDFESKVEDARRLGRFRGLAAIDVSRVRGKDSNFALSEVLSCAERNIDDIIFAFWADGKSDLDNLRRELSKRLVIRELAFGKSKGIHVAARAIEVFLKYGHSLSSEAYPKLVEIMQKVRTGGAFAGYKSAELAAMEILSVALKRKEESINSETLERYMNSVEYSNRILAESPESKVIGFELQELSETK
ncbi:MAG: hypothetical protein LBU32_15720 [Clostridiales bacterium]|jgi:hypothetical protein|nr:hypothetical protein [Clostridiales bacterium]